MPGFSLSLMKVDDERLRHLDAPTTAPAWPGVGLLNTAPLLDSSDRAAKAGAAAVSVDEALSSDLSDGLRQAAHAVANALVSSEPLLTELDSRTGDGDLGSSMVRGATAIVALPNGAWRSPETALAGMGHAVRRAIAGSSGPFYAT
jgi:dihydroxyacetone kinase